MPQKTIIPEVLQPEEELPADLAALRTLGILLDRAFEVPGTTRRVGIAPIIGLVPGIGDFIGAILSTWIVVGALRHRVPPRKILRMVLNIIVDAAIGTIPVIGDIFDFLFQENLSNVETLLKYRNRRKPPRSTAQISLIAMGILMAILFAVVAMIVLLVLMLAWTIDKLYLLMAGGAILAGL
ncbi:MAG: DUF4112 domain-containing protein [Thermoanaerobaculia bacterium]|nr:DUF4112 domain-containing protein [Thermoanaerobaculia bacterium]